MSNSSSRLWSFSMSVFASKHTCAVMYTGCKKSSKQTGNHIYVFNDAMKEHINSENSQFDFNCRMHNGNLHVKCLKSWYVDKIVKSNLFYVLVIVSSIFSFICSLLLFWILFKRLFKIYVLDGIIFKNKNDFRKLPFPSSKKR